MYGITEARVGFDSPNPLPPRLRCWTSPWPSSSLEPLDARPPTPRCPAPPSSNPHGHAGGSRCRSATRRPGSLEGQLEGGESALGGYPLRVNIVAGAFGSLPEGGRLPAEAPGAGGASGRSTPGQCRRSTPPAPGGPYGRHRRRAGGYAEYPRVVVDPGPSAQRPPGPPSKPSGESPTPEPALPPRGPSAGAPSAAPTCSLCQGVGRPAGAHAPIGVGDRRELQAQRPQEGLCPLGRRTRRPRGATRWPGEVFDPVLDPDDAVTTARSATERSPYRPSRR
jgi:hypothetical protein